MLSPAASSMILFVCALVAALAALTHGFAALRDRWMARAARRARASDGGPREGAGAVVGTVMADDDASPFVTTVVTQCFAEPFTWRECAPRRQHGRPFALRLDGGEIVRVDTAAGVSLHLPLVNATAATEASDGDTRTLLAEVVAGQRVTVFGSLVRQDAGAPAAGHGYRGGVTGSAWTLRSIAGRAPVVSGEEDVVTREGHAHRHRRTALWWGAVLLLSQGGIFAETVWMKSHYERVAARSEGCTESYTRRGKLTKVSRFRLVTGAHTWAPGCWSEGTDHSLLVTHDEPVELAPDQAPDQLSLWGFMWLGLTFALPGLVLAGEARGEVPWYDTRRYHTMVPWRGRVPA